MPHRYNTNSDSSGLADIVGDDMIVSLYCAASDVNVANTIMHELGHNLGLRHGGFEDQNFKPNYNSVMNYEYQFTGVDTNCAKFGDGLLDYSRGGRRTLNELSVNESLGVCVSPVVAWDFNNSGLIESSVYSSDINFDGLITEALSDSNDWANLLYDFTPARALTKNRARSSGTGTRTLGVLSHSSCGSEPVPCSSPWWQRSRASVRRSGLAATETNGATSV
jgi:hypothetical protein